MNEREWGKLLALAFGGLILINCISVVDGSPPQNPIGIAGQIYYNGVLVGSGVHVTVKWIEGNTYDNATTNNGNYAVAIAGMEDGDTVQVNVSYMGKNVFNVTVIDTTAMANWCNISIIPSGGNEPPVIDIPDRYEGHEGDIISFDASDCYDPDGNIVSYTWSFYGDGNPYTLGNKKVSKKWMDEISCIVYLSVTDNSGDTTMAMREINIANSMPHATLEGNDSIYTGETAYFNASGSYDAGNDVLHYDWDIDGDEIWDYIDVNANISAVYNTAGTYVIVVRVSDGDGGVDIAIHNLIVLEEGNEDDNDTIVNKKPIVNFSITGFINENGEFIKDSNISLKSNSYDPDGYIVNWTWNFMGSINYSENVSFELKSMGNKTIRLTVKDNNGSKNYTVKEIVVGENTSASVCSLNITLPYDDITFSVKEVGTDKIVYTGSNTKQVLIDNLRSGLYKIYCSRGDKTWNEDINVDGNTTYLVSVPSNGGHIPVGTEVIFMALFIAMLVGMLRRRRKCVR